MQRHGQSQEFMIVNINFTGDIKRTPLTPSPNGQESGGDAGITDRRYKKGPFPSEICKKYYSLHNITFSSCTGCNSHSRTIFCCYTKVQ
jgi:hypothetical protein